MFWSVTLTGPSTPGNPEQIPTKVWISTGRNMSSEILISVRPNETRVAVVDNKVLVDLVVEPTRKRGLAGSMFRGRVLRILPGMQAAFVDIGLERAAFLYVGDVRDDVSNPDNLYDDEPERSPQRESPGSDEDVSLEGNSQSSSPTTNEQMPNIQDLLHEGQNILVQVAKDPLGTKGARITTHVSLPGRYVVYMPTVSHLGISRRIENEEERDRLKMIVEKYRPQKGGFIVRTACEGASEEEIKADIRYLSLLYQEVSKAYDKRKNVGMVHNELDVELRALRDMLTEDVHRVVVDEKEAFKKISKFVSQFTPKLKNRMELYEEPTPLLDRYEIDLEISRSLGRKVWLKSGGYIIIDEAEALVVIDVNTGRYVGKKDLEDTILKTNLEAVKEIAHQLRIRNCGGIIIVDFIDMERETSREKVLQALKDDLKKDRAKTSVSAMSALGLVEMTRKRTRPSLVRVMCHPCSYCDGKGYLKSKATISNEIFKEIERLAANRGSFSTVVHCHPELADWIYDNETEMLEYLEKTKSMRVIFKVEPSYHIEQYEIYKG